MWKKIKFLHGTYTISVITELRLNGQICQEETKIADSFVTFFASASTTENYLEEFPKIK